MNKFISIKISSVLKLCILCFVFAGCDNKGQDTEPAPNLEQNRPHPDSSLSHELSEDSTQDQEIASGVVEKLLENAVNEEEGDSSSTLPVADVSIDKSLVNNSVWRLFRSSLPDSYIGTAFAIGPNQFITTFQAFDYIASSQMTFEELGLSNEKGENLSLKSLIKLDPASDLVLFETNEDVRDYIDPQLYLSVEDQTLSDSAKISVFTYIKETLKEVKQNDGTLYEDESLYVFTTNLSKWESFAGGSPLIKDGKLIAIQGSRVFDNMVMAIKAQHLQKIINGDEGIVHCSQLDLNSCIQRGIDHLKESESPLAFYNLYTMGYIEFNRDEELFEEFSEIIKKSTGTVRNILATELAILNQVKKRNRGHVMAWFKAAGKDGFAPAQYSLGRMYLEGIDLEGIDLKEAFEWFKKSSDQGLAPAQYYLGVMYSNGWGLDEGIDLKEAFEWFKKSSDQGFGPAQNNLGVMYLNGWGLDKEDEEKAFEWFKSSAEQGDMDAQRNLGVMYLNGWGLDEGIDLKEAFEWFKKAVDQGDSMAQYSLGRMYLEGLVQADDGSVVEDSLIQAYIYLYKAKDSVLADDPDLNDSIDKLEDRIDEEDRFMAQYRLGREYLEIWRKGLKGFKLFESFAEQGSAPAQHFLGVMYLEALGETKKLTRSERLEKAFELFKSSADQGLRDAQHFLGIMYLKALHGDQDLEKAVESFKKSADQGFALAQVIMANFYSLGLKEGEKVIVKLDTVSAYYYLSLAQYNGLNQIQFPDQSLVPIQEFIDTVEENMSEEDIKVAHYRLEQTMANY